MYLVHVRIKSAGDQEIPPDAATKLLKRTDHLVEHIVVHAVAPGRAVVGIFVVANSLGDAEAVARTACEAGLASIGELANWQVERAEAPLVPLFYERDVGTPGVTMDGTCPDPNCPH